MDDTTPLAGSELPGFADRPSVGRPAEDEPIDVTLHLRPGEHPDAPARLRQLEASPPLARVHLTREEHAELFAARPEDVAAVERFASEQGLEITDSNPRRSWMKLRGSRSQLESAFGTELHLFEHRGRQSRGYRGQLRLPSPLAPAVVAATGLANHPIARASAAGTAPPADSGAAATSALPAKRCNADDLRRACRFPANATGKGQCIGILGLSKQQGDPYAEPGGVSLDDLKAYPFDAARLALFQVLGPNKPYLDTAQWRGLFDDPGFPANPKAQNTNFLYNSDGPVWTMEATADTQICLALAPEAAVILRLTEDYQDDAFLDALGLLIHEDQPQPTILSISLDWVEDKYHITQSFRDQAQALFRQANLLGMTVCAASGDWGSHGQPVEQNEPYVPAVQFPASSAEVLACGGADLRSAGARLEFGDVWNEPYLGLQRASGGAFEAATEEPLPAWQRAAVDEWRRATGSDAAGRGVPDVAGPADYAHGLRLLLDGLEFNANGTSAATPLWAALLACIYQRLAEAGVPRVGHITPSLYEPAVRKAFVDIAGGDNALRGGKVYQAVAGCWDPCTGLGGPDGEALLAALRAMAKAARSAAGDTAPKGAKKRPG